MYDAIIEIENLSFAYGRQLVLENIDFKTKAGDFVAIIGPNGGGKTTLLKLLLGLLEAEKGNVRIFGQPPRRVSYRIGYVPQEMYINRHFPVSALDIVLMGKLNPGRRWSRPSGRDRRMAQEVLDRMEMGPYFHKRIDQMSGGQRQRIFIARALVSEPDILFLDEPTANIDTKGQADIYDLLKDLNQKMTILMVSHDLMFISSYVKSVACVNRHVHYHDHPEITDEMVDMCNCPVDFVAHGLPHRILAEH